MNSPETKNRIKDDLLNKVLLLSTLVIFSYAIAQIRAIHFGWNISDLFHFVCILLLFLLVIFRRKVSARYKSLYIMAIYTLGGVSGVLTLGLLAASIFIIPAATVIVSICYSRKVAFSYIFGLLGFFSVMAVLFSSGMMEVQVEPNILQTSYLHWFTYILNIGLFCMIACTIILNYRQAMEMYIDQACLQRDHLMQTNEQLEHALSEVKTLSGLLPICSSCNKIRDDKGYWNRIEAYIETRTDAHFSHGLCTECQDKLYGDKEWYQKHKKKREEKE